MQSETEINFRFGDGPPRPSQGACVIKITPPPKVANKSTPITFGLRVHAVKGNIPLLISRESLSRLDATLNFRESILKVKNDVDIQLIKTPSGHLMLPGLRAKPGENLAQSPLGNQIYANTLDVPMAAISKEELRKIHLHLGHCSENTLIAMLRAAHMAIPTDLIKELYDTCKCQTGVRRITPPNVSSWTARYNGETVGADLRYPFVDTHPEING